MLIFYRCISDLKFRNPSSLIRHYRDEHSAFPPIFENKPKFICSHCSNIYISEKSLKAHILSHSVNHSRKINNLKAQSAQCGYCEKTYSTKQRLNEHIILQHENSARFECDICHRKHATEANLRGHLENYYIEWVMLNLDFFLKKPKPQFLFLKKKKSKIGEKTKSFFFFWRKKKTNLPIFFFLIKSPKFFPI